MLADKETELFDVSDSIRTRIFDIMIIDFPSRHYERVVARGVGVNEFFSCLKFQLTEIRRNE